MNDKYTDGDIRTAEIDAEYIHFSFTSRAFFIYIIAFFIVFVKTVRPFMKN